MTIPSGPLAGMVLEGTIDKLLVDTRNGNIWIRDHKSTGMKTLAVIFAGFPWSTQARIYRILTESYLLGLMAQEAKTGEKIGPYDGAIKGFILDGIMKPGIKLCGKDEKNAKLWNCDVEDAYLQRVKEWYGEKDTAAIKSQAIMFNEPLYSIELSAELCKMYDLSKRGNNPQEYQRDPSRFHCFLYESQCVFYDLCSMPRSSWPELFETKYKIKELEKKDEKETTDKSASAVV